MGLKLLYLDPEDKLKFEKVLDTEDGRVWEFLNFKEYRDIILNQ